jgi:hypothetical protein
MLHYIDTLRQNKWSISVKNSGVGIKAWKEVPVNIIPKSFLKCCVSNAEDGMQDDILSDDSEQIGESASSSEKKV